MLFNDPLPGTIPLFLTNEQIIDDCPFGKDYFWRVIKKDPRFPEPLNPGSGGKGVYNGRVVHEYFKRLAEEGLPLKK